ncbi:class I SAM-dependent methyltransferase [Pseudonocardia petroleophila]|uniref:Class I SAM-dependent methyltransferase n=1 Tax=Pseudonocardia petroleophila TaxID=37331 RepID=A0A7G7MQX4_9PSEU|nr:class I SAM-dependent methyltransferase [Pseudonocardia petroleophila]QNG55185.1 class I SAM-dependent methyltransferase [Pseudonocardia petroleophila]
MTTSTDLSTLGSRHRALWASGDYPAVAADLIPDLGATLVEAAGVTAGQRVLDVGAGTGNAAIPAALTGADVVASDLTPELLDAGAEIAAARGAHLQWVEADAHALPFETGEFDTVLSCVGVMFAPFHERAAGELLRVCRPGGTIGLLSWTPEGFVGRLFATMKPFAPAPPPGASPAPLWGSEEHVRTLLGDGVRELRAERRTTTFAVADSAVAFREWWKTHYGPTIAVYRGLDADRAAELDAAFLRMLEQTRTGGVWDAEYLLVTSVRT